MSTSQQGAKPAGGVSNRVLLAVGLIAAVTYIIALWAKLPTMQLITKGIPVLCLIVWVFKLPRDRFANLIMAGLIFSLAGDLILQLSNDLFVIGLLLFLVAHLLYIAAFLGVTRRGSWVRLLPFAAWGIIAFLILQPYLGNMLLPVAGYIIVIEVMMWRSTALVGAQGKARDFELAAALGAIAFGLSDTLLALNRFIWHDTLTMFSITEAAPFIPTLTITLYWLAQCGLALAAGWEAKDRARSTTAK
jgi:alkenylglycerophosphocholine hydrolase